MIRVADSVCLRSNYRDLGLRLSIVLQSPNDSWKAAASILGMSNTKSPETIASSSAPKPSVRV